MRLDPFIRNYETFVTELTLALQNDATAFYLDTSTLTWAINLGRDARREFLAWCRSKPSGNLRVPVWAAHELHKHLLRGSLNANLQKTLGDTEKKLSEFARVTTERVDDELCLARGFSGREAYVSDVHRTIERIKELAKIAGDEAQMAVAADEVVDFVNERLLDTDLDGIIKKLGDVGELRYSHLMPPGYHDQKPENKFGDVVIWEEILEDLKSRTDADPFDTVLISRDEKTDWVSSAPLVVNGERVSKSNRAHELDVTLAHPLLIHEFSKRTQSRTIYVVPPSFAASALHYASRGGEQTSSVLNWFSASHKPDAVEKLATAALVRPAPPPVAPAGGGYARPEISQIVAANTFAMLAEYAAEPFQRKPDLVAAWSDAYARGNLDALAFGKLLAGLAMADPARAAEAGALLESLSRAVDLVRWNTAVTSFIASAYFDAFGQALTSPQPTISMITLQLEEDPRTAPAFEALAKYLADAEVQLPYIPGTGRRAVPYEVDFMQGAANRPNLLRGVRIASQPVLVEDLAGESRQRFDALLGRPPSQGCNGRELRSAIARQLLIPADLLSTAWDRKAFFWSDGMGLAGIDTTSEGGVSQLEDLED